MGTGNKVEMLIAICAVVTSAIAVFIAWDQGRVMRAQQHGSVYPVLQADGYVSADPHVREIGVRFRNSGVGPALIESVDMLKDGERLVSLNAYRDELPRISLELAHWLVDKRVGMIGVEQASVADVNNRQELTEVHRTLFEGGVLIVEGLANLDQLTQPEVEFIALPLNLPGIDGSPVRAIAIERISSEPS